MMVGGGEVELQIDRHDRMVERYRNGKRVVASIEVPDDDPYPAPR